MSVPRSPLCPRCGATRAPAQDAQGGRYEAVCPSCGLGFSGTRMTMRQADPMDDAARAEWERVRAERAERKRRTLARCGYPVYGLDETWTGRRWLGGWSESNSNVSSVELAHDDAFDPAATLVRIGTTLLTAGRASRTGTRSSLAGDLARVMTAQSLAQHLWMAGAEHSPAVQATFTAADPTASWSPLSLTVEGTPTEFRSLGDTTVWVALTTSGNTLVSVLACNVGPSGMRLVVIDDLEIYLADDGLP